MITTYSSWIDRQDSSWTTPASTSLIDERGIKHGVSSPHTASLCPVFITPEPSAHTMARLTSCILHCAVTLQIQALKRSQISILVVNRPLKPLGRYLTPGEPNHTLNHSCCVVPHEYFISWGIYGKTSRICFLQSSSFRMPSTLTMLHSFHYWIAIGFGSPHHYYPCLSV